MKRAQEEDILCKHDVLSTLVIAKTLKLSSPVWAIQHGASRDCQSSSRRLASLKVGFGFREH